MPRKTDDELASSVSALAVIDGRPEFRDLREALQRRVTRRIHRRIMPDVYKAMTELLTSPGSKEDGPKVNLILGLLSKFAPDRREPGNQAVNVGRGAKNVTFNTIVSDGAQIDRGTAEARERAIEINAERRERIDGATARDSR